ncbi:MAG: hypothetical protein KAS70_07335, partial [Planctomycetes bacterium]|nr:hypothetical protein [Planctomycetota bacterium]
SKLKQSTDELKTTLTKLTRDAERIKLLEEHLVSANKSLDKELGEKEVYLAHLKEVNKKNAVFAKEIGNLKIKNSLLTKDLERSEEKFHIRATDITELTEKVKKRTGKAEELQIKVGDLVNQIQKEIAEKSAYLDQIKQRNDEIVSLTGQVTELTLKNRELHSNITAWQEKVGKISSTQSANVTDLANAESKINQLSAELKESASLRLKAEKAAEETYHYQKRLQDALNKSSLLNEEVTTYRSKSNETASRLAITERELNRKISNLTDNLQSVNREKLDYLNQLKMSHDRIQAQTNELNRITNKNDSLTKDQQLLNLEVTRLTSEKDKYFKSLSKINKRYNDLSKTNSTLSEKLIKTNRDIKFYSDQINRLKEETDSLSRQSTNLNQQIAQLHKENTELTRQSRRNSEKNDQLTSQLNTVQDRVSTLSGENTALRKTSLEQQKSWQKKNEAFTAETNQLKRGKNTSISLAAQLQNKVQSLTQEVSLLQKKNESLETNIKNLQTSMHQTSTRTDKQATTLVEANQKLAQLRQIENKQRTQIKDLAEKVASLGSNFTALEQKNTFLTKDNEDKTVYLNEMQSVMGQNTKLFTQEIDELKTKNTRLQQTIRNLQLEIDVQVKEKAKVYIQELEKVKKDASNQKKVIKKLHWSLAFLYQKTASTREALKEYQTLLQLDPSDYRPYYQIGRIHETQSKKPRQAIAAYKKYLAAIKNLPSNPPAPYPDEARTKQMIDELQNLPAEKQ